MMTERPSAFSQCNHSTAHSQLMMQTDGNCRLVVRGNTLEEEEEQYGDRRGCRCRCRCCCDRAHRGKARCSSLILVLLLMMMMVVVVAVVVMLLGALGWFDLARGQKLGKSPDSTLPASDYGAQTSALRGKGFKRRPSAMLTAPLNNSDGNDDDVEYLRWESKIPRAFCHGGFNYSDRALVVPVMGIYRVFLQITYEGENCSEPEINLVSRVLMYTDSYPEDTRLLSASNMVKCGPSSWRKSLYSAGLYKLEAKSRLRVTASHRGFLAKNEDEVFFGAELV